MTPPDHVLAGLSAAAVYISLCGASGTKRVSPLTAVIICAVFAVLPDIDSFRGVYSSTDPFTGHRGITHSVFFAALSSLSVSICYHITRRILSSPVEDNTGRTEYSKDIFLLALFSGLTHLLLDLPQVPGVWRGIPLFFPYMKDGTFVRSGGWGFIGWYDYRITWILFISVSFSFVLLLISFIIRNLSRLRRYISVTVIIFSLLSYLYITKTVMQSEYVSSKRWNSSQQQYLAAKPVLFRKGVSQGRNLVYYLIYSRYHQH